MRLKPVVFILFLLLSIIFLIIISSLSGPVKIPLDDIFQDKYLHILRLRLFRIFLAILVGSGLSLAGVILQGLLRNPLAEPYVLGVSSGAGLGAVIGLLFFSQTIPAGLLAFSGGIITIILVFNLAKVDNRLSPENLIIAGILVNALFSSLLMFFVFNSNSTKVHSVIWWLLGNLQIYRPRPLAVLSITVFSGILLTYKHSRDLNALSLGEEEAIHLGVDKERVKKVLLLVATFVSSIIVSTCGIIGFVGLIIPHITRKLVGPDHRLLILFSIFTGATFLLLCDILSRTIMSPREIPVGVVTAFIGVPFFIYILKRSKRIYFR